jgi:hypothetical protein
MGYQSLVSYFHHKYHYLVKMLQMSTTLNAMTRPAPPSSPDLRGQDAAVLQIARQFVDAFRITVAEKALLGPTSEDPAKDDPKPEEPKARASKLAYKKVNEV